MSTLTPTTKPGLYRSILRGDIKLWKIFWFAFAPAPFVLYMLSIGLIIYAYRNPGTLTVGTALNTSLVVTAIIMSLLSFSVWLAAAHVRRLWKYLARLCVVAYLIWYGRRIVLMLYALNVSA